MILIFGGAYQGKLDYALKRFNWTENDVYRCDDGNISNPAGKKIIYEIDKWFLALIKNNLDIEAALNKFINENMDAVVICNDISCGVVPVEKLQRAWREATGRSLAVLSGLASEAIRLFCGIPSKIK